MIAGRRPQRDSARSLDELRHPHPTEHDGVEPLDRHDAGPVAASRAAPCDLRDTTLELSDDVSAAGGPPQRISDPKDIVPDIVQTCWMEVDDTNRLMNQLGRRGADVAERHRAD